MKGDPAAASAGRSGVPQSLLVVRLSAFGDVLHTIPAVAALRDALPETRISWVVEKPYAEVVSVVAKVDVVPVSIRKWGRSLWGSRDAIAEAWRQTRGFDTVIDFQGLIKSAMLARLSGAPTRWGFDSEAIREKPAAWLTNHHAAVDQSRHVIEWNLALARAVAPSLGDVPKVDFSAYAELPNTETWAIESEPGQGLANQRSGASPQVILLPGAGKAFKQWPVERFRELATYLGDRAVVAWGPGEEELARAIGAPLAPPTSLRELACLLRKADLVIGADTGPLHLAAALGTKVIGLYGPTNPRRNGPYGQLQNCVETYSTTRSMHDIAVGDVIRKIEEVPGA